MGRYDAYDMDSGFGVDYSARSGGKSKASKSTEPTDNKKKAKGGGGFLQRGRLLSRDDSSNGRGRSRSKSRGDQSQSSKRSTGSTKSKSELNVRSLSREPNKRKSSKNSVGNGSSRAGNSKNSSSGTPRAINAQRSRSRSRSRSRGRGNSARSADGYDIEDEINDNWSVPNDDASFESKTDHRGEYRSRDDDTDDSGTHEGNIKTKYTYVTPQPFLPPHQQGSLLGGPGEITMDAAEIAASVAAALSVQATNSGPPLKQCLYSDLRSLRSWNWRFTLKQILAGFATALTQVPECVSYAYIARMDPLHALQAAWISNVVAPVVGGRPGMICGPSGLGAIALRFVVASYGPEYVFYAVVLSGFFQVLFGGLRIGKHLRLMPPGVTIGFVNALCLLIVALQLRYFKAMPGIEATYSTSLTEDGGEMSAADPYSTAEEPTRRNLASSSSDVVVTEDDLDQPWAYFLGQDVPWTESKSQFVIVSIEAVLTLLLCILLPRYISVVPSGLIAIVLFTCISIGIRASWPSWTTYVAPTIGDYCISELPTYRVYSGIFDTSYTLPPLFEWNTLGAIIPAGFSLFAINLLETMVTINVADKYTATDSDQDRVFYGQGVANLVCGFMAGTSGTGLAHSSLYGTRMGGITNISTFSAGIFMLLVIMFMYPAVAEIPLGVVMGITLHLIWNMIQWKPIIGFWLKLVPSGCLLRVRPQWMSRRLATPDVFSTFVTSIFTLCASTYGFAGYLVGILCYACDPISHAIISRENENGYSAIGIELNLPAPPVAKKIEVKMPKFQLFKRRKDASTKSSYPTVEDDEESPYSFTMDPPEPAIQGEQQTKDDKSTSECGMCGVFDQECELSR